MLLGGGIWMSFVEGSILTGMVGVGHSLSTEWMAEIKAQCTRLDLGLWKNQLA